MGGLGGRGGPARPTGAAGGGRPVDAWRPADQRFPRPVGQPHVRAVGRLRDRGSVMAREHPIQARADSPDGGGGEVTEPFEQFLELGVRRTVVCHGKPRIRGQACRQILADRPAAKREAQDGPPGEVLILAQRRLRGSGDDPLASGFAALEQQRPTALELAAGLNPLVRVVPVLGQAFQRPSFSRRARWANASKRLAYQPPRPRRNRVRRRRRRRGTGHVQPVRTNDVAQQASEVIHAIGSGFGNETDACPRAAGASFVVTDATRP